MRVSIVRSLSHSHTHCGSDRRLSCLLQTLRLTLIDMGHASSSAASVRRRTGPSLARLPDALIQSVCHGLSAMEILSLARASKQLMHAIDAPFAWMHAPLSISVDLLRCPQLAPKRSCLCGRAPVSLVWTRLSSVGDASSLLDSKFLSGPSRIHALDLSGVCDPAQWIPLLMDPRCSAVRKLRVHSIERSGDVPTAALEVMRGLPQLHTLVLYPDHASADSVDWSLLAQMPRLTSLEICNTAGFEVKSQLPSIVRCTQLRELRLSGFPQPAVVLFEAIAPLSQLRLLWLARDCSNVDTVMDLPSRFRAACARMQSLEDLQFAASPVLRQALPFLSECQSLKWLSLRRRVHSVGQETAVLYCSPHLVALLTALPRCVFTLRVATSPHMTLAEQQQFRSTFDEQCAGQRTQQAAMHNAPGTSINVNARMRIAIVPVQKGE